MTPVLFTINDFEVRSYLLIISTAIILAILLIRYYEIPLLKSAGLCPESIYRYNGESLFIALIFIVIGARLGFVITNWPLYAEEPVSILAFWKGGLAFHGGLIAALIALSLHSYFRRIPYFSLLDLAIPYVTLAYALGRIGCFLNGCCHGYSTGLPWALVYPAIDGEARHPTQLYSAGAALVIFFLLLNVHRKSYPPGNVFARFLIFIGVYRFAVEFFRVSEAVVSIMSLAQLVSLAAIVGGMMLQLTLNRKGER